MDDWSCSDYGWVGDYVRDEKDEENKEGYEVFGVVMGGIGNIDGYSRDEDYGVDIEGGGWGGDKGCSEGNSICVRGSVE